MTNSPDRFSDHRGTIQDLLGPVDSVTEIFTKMGEVRGNHIHAETIQWTYIVFGSLEVVHAIGGSRKNPTLKSHRYKQGKLFEEPAGIAHAWRALEDTLVLVFTKGPRSGANYENDTQRLEPGERLL